MIGTPSRQLRMQAYNERNDNERARLLGLAYEMEAVSSLSRSHARDDLDRVGMNHPGTCMCGHCGRR